MAQSVSVPTLSTADLDLTADPAVVAEKSGQKKTETPFWIKPSRGLEAFVQIDVAHPLGPINRNIFGACLMWPPMKKVDGKPSGLGLPFSKEAIEASKTILTGSSVRLWHRTTPGWTKWWLDFIDQVKPAQSYIFADNTFRKEIVRYTSEEDNNLYGHQTPRGCAQRVREINKKAYPGHPDGLGIVYWELWNEPRFRQNGGWDPVEHARYCLDAARRMKEVDPTIKIGPHIYGDVRDDWNQKMLNYLAEHDTDKQIDFIVNHYYDTKWFQQWDMYGSYLGRVAYSSEIRQWVQNDRKIIDQLSGGRWELVCSEWNMHPKRYDWPGQPTRDLAVALFQASTLQAFVEEGMDAAQVFALRSKSFGLFDGDHAEQLWPTYHVFELYAQHYTGQRLRDETVSPAFAWHWRVASGKTGPPRQVPYVDVIASGKDQKQVTLMVVNKHPDETIFLHVTLDGAASPTSIEMTTLTGKDKEASEAQLIQTKPAVTDPLVVSLPPHSFSAIHFYLED